MRIGLMALSGHNNRAVVALCRWASAAGLTVHLAARDADDELCWTDYSRWFFFERRTCALSVDEIESWVRQLSRAHGYERVLLVPSTEFFNRFMLAHRDALEAVGAIVPLVGAALYERIADKATFAEMCAAAGIPVPAVTEGLPDRLPFVAKPRCYQGSAGTQLKPQLVFTSADRERFEREQHASDYFFQEFVDGDSIYLLAHVARDGQVTTYAQENLMQQPHGGSIVLARADDFHREPEAKAYLELLIGAGYHGLVMVEVRRCRFTGRAIMIEANPRLWGPMQFMLDQRIDPFAPWLADYGVTVPEPVSLGPVRPYYFWSGGISRHEACTYHRYTAQRFASEYPVVAASDLLAREDTWRLYRRELDLRAL